MHKFKKQKRRLTLFIALFIALTMPVTAFAEKEFVEDSKLSLKDYVSITSSSSDLFKDYVIATQRMSQAGLSEKEDIEKWAKLQPAAKEVLVSGYTTDETQSEATGWTSLGGTTYEYTTVSQNHLIYDMLSGEKAIDYLCSNKVSDMGNQFKKVWKTKFQTRCANNGVTNDIDDLISQYENLERASAKVQMLTWSGAVEGASQDLELKQHQGQLYTLLTKITALNGNLDGTSMPIFSYMQFIGAVLMFVYFFKELNDLEESRNMSDGELLRIFIKFLLALTVMWHIDIIALLLVRLACLFNSSFITQSYTAEKMLVDGTANAQLSFWQSLADAKESIPTKGLSELTVELAEGANSYDASVDSGILGNLTRFFSGLSNSVVTNFLGNGIYQLASSLVVYGILLETVIRFLFSPIYIADLASTERHPHGYEQLKKLVACIVAGTIMMLVIYLTDFLKDSLDATSALWVDLTSCGMLAKSKQLAFEMFGCH